jgi:RNA polymerase sigma-70 factor (ECF subfamily)
VLAVIYLIYTAGQTRQAEPDLCREAIRLARILATLIPTSQRRPACSRFRADGILVLLADRDRSGWDRPLIEEGQGILRGCLRRNHPGPYQLQAAINAVHADAPTIEQTTGRR